MCLNYNLKREDGHPVLENTGEEGGTAPSIRWYCYQAPENLKHGVFRSLNERYKMVLLIFKYSYKRVSNLFFIKLLILWMLKVINRIL